MTPSQAPHLEQDAQDPGLVRLSGHWTLHTALAAAEVLRGIPDALTGIDASGSTVLDSAGVLQLLRVARRADLGDDALSFREEHRALVSTIEEVADDRPRAKRDFGVLAALERLGVSVHGMGHNIVALASFLGENLVKGARLIKEPRRFRLTATVAQMEQVGLDAVPLVALLITLPLLTFIAMVAGLAGGITVGAFDLGIPPQMYIARMHETMEVRNMLVGLSKAPVFALVIGLIGCLEGLKVEGTAQSVGERTTSSVVQAISLVIILDAFAALWFMKMGW
jgi:ABC-type transporter Mla maintaining outer membrane lipid asymmetry permease subunit MlaE